MAQNRQKGQGAGQGDRVSSAGEAIPMQKAGLTTYVVIGVGVLVIGGTIAITSGGSDSEAEKKAVDIQTQANQQDAPQMTAKEQQEHLKMTARAFERAEESSKLKKAEQARHRCATNHAGIAASRSRSLLHKDQTKIFKAKFLLPEILDPG